jgi:hypothetical protein
MNYLGHSIVNEVGGGGSTNVKNALSQDTVAMQTVLSNFQPAVSLHPYRFSNGESTVYNYNLLNDVITQTISGKYSPSSYSLEMTALNYKGTYAFKMIGSWYGAGINNVGLIPQNSFSFRVQIGNQIILTMPTILFTNNVGDTDPMYIEIDGIIDVLNSPSASTIIQTTAKYQLRNSTFSNSAYTYNSSTLDLSDEAFRNYTMDLRIIGDTIPINPILNFIVFKRLVGTLNCVHSDPYTG